MGSPPVKHLERKLIFCSVCDFFCDADERPAMDEHQNVHVFSDSPQFTIRPIPK